MYIYKFFCGWNEIWGDGCVYLIEPTVTGCHMCWIVMKSLFVHFILFYFFLKPFLFW